MLFKREMARVAQLFDRQVRMTNWEKVSFTFALGNHSVAEPTADAVFRVITSIISKFKQKFR